MSRMGFRSGDRSRFGGTSVRFKGVPVSAADDWKGARRSGRGWIGPRRSSDKGMTRRRRRGSGVRWLNHYSSAQSILVVGDGDFSFSLALAAAFGSGRNIVATSLDSYEALIGKYSEAEANVRYLERMGTKVLHNINAKNMTGCHHLRIRQFDRIVFNFPHAGFRGKEEEMRVVIMHRKLVKGFFRSARPLLQPYGEIHISHKIGYPYDAWDIQRLAFESFLTTIEIVRFHKDDYPGYNQKKGDGPRCNEPFPLGACCTFKFGQLVVR